jgi:hypothetical protein
MLRDITMIVSVMVSLVSIGFGFYKNIEAANNRAFIYEQAYRIVGQIEQADIPQQEKNRLTSDALNGLSAPPPVIDLSQSSADIGDEGACTPNEERECTALADRLGRENTACERSKEPTGPVCAQAARTRTEILQKGCFTCFTP